MLEHKAAETVLFDLLDGEINSMPFYIGYAPEGASKPFILAQFVSSEDVICQWANRYGTFMSYLVEVYVEGESFPYDDAESVDELLNGYRGTKETCLIDITRDHPVSVPESYDGHEIRRSGAIYKFIVRRN